MYSRIKLLLLTFAVGSSSVMPVAQTHTAGAHMTRSTTDETCLQLKDDNTWTTKPTWLTGVGTATTNLAGILAAVNNNATHLTSSTHPPTVGYVNGIAWNSTDIDTNTWITQGLTEGVNGTTNYAIASWHFNDDGDFTFNDGSRLTITDTTDLSAAKYRYVILINPTGTQTYEQVKIHVGGIAVLGNYLYIADTNKGFRVFDLNNFRAMSGSTACRDSSGAGIFAKVGSDWCAAGYGYALPQVGSYTMPSAKADGTAISAACKPKFSFAGKDTRNTQTQLLSGEYCDATSDSNDCEGDTTGLNGRLYQWPVGSDSKLVNSSLYVSPTKVYFMNERQVQGVAPDLISGAEADSYWLSSSRSNGALYKVTPTATAKSWLYSDSLMPWHPEGLHATGSGHLWILTEGRGVSATGWDSNPATGGRVLIYINQSAVN